MSGKDMVKGSLSGAGDGLDNNGKGLRVEELEARLDESQSKNKELERAILALRESEEKYREMVENANSIILRWDTDGRITFVNEYAQNFFGYTADEMIGKDVRMLVPATETTGRDLTSLLEDIKQYPDRFTNNVNENIRKNGERAWVSWTNKVIRDERGNVVEILVVGNDITEHKVMENKLAHVASFPELNPNPIFEVDEDGNIIYANPSTGRLFPDLRQKGMSHPLLKEITFDAISKSESNELTRDIRINDTSYQQTIRYMPDRKTIRIYSTDITESKWIEDVLQTTIQRFYGILSNVSTGILLVTNEGRIEYANQAFCDYFELDEPPLDLIGLSPLEMIGKIQDAYLDPNGAVVRINEIVARGQTVRGEEVAMRGGRICIRDFVPLFAKGKQFGRIWLHQDVTELKKAEDVLRENEAHRKISEAVEAERHRLFDVLENLPAMICLLTQDYHIAFANRSFRDKFGESHGRHCYESCFGQDSPCDFCESYEVLKTGKPHHWEINNTDGTVIDAYDMPFTDVDGKPMILEMDIDITVRKRAEAVLRYMNDVLERHVDERTAELNKAKQQAEMYLDLIDHDISDMHQIALGHLELAREIMAEESGLKPEDKELIDTPMNSLNRCTELINYVRNLQNLSRCEYKDEALDLYELLSGITKEYGPQSIKLTGNGPSPVLANKLLRDVFTNLIGNAIKYSNGNGVAINILLENAIQDGKNYYRVLVEDNGPGIPDDMKDKIFNRLRHGHTQATGWGLGLYLVKSLVDSYHGVIRVEDRVMGDRTKGSRFIVLLPAAEGSNAY
jgi:PAS domain S-box-containing protein